MAALLVFLKMLQVVVDDSNVAATMTHINALQADVFNLARLDGNVATISHSNRDAYVVEHAVADRHVLSVLQKDGYAVQVLKRLSLNQFVFCFWLSRLLIARRRCVSVLVSHDVCGRLHNCVCPA